jgi:hypothetical protein
VHGDPHSDSAVTKETFMPYELNPGDVLSAFSGRTFEASGGPILFQTVGIGALQITSGRLGACDPLIPDATAFAQTVPCGSHPVDVAVARFGDGDERIAFARVRFGDREPVQWQMALWSADQDVSSLEADGYFGYGVDSGTGCFMDPVAAGLLLERMTAENEYYEVMIEQMHKTYQHTRSWGDIRPSPQRGENIICFSSGLGDGFYPSYFGFDSDGAVCTLVTDFLVLPP